MAQTAVMIDQAPAPVPFPCHPNVSEFLRETFDLISRPRKMTGILGDNESGKTDIGLLDLQVGLEDDTFQEAATNVELKGSYPAEVQRIITLPALVRWGKECHKEKAFFLDDIAATFHRRQPMNPANVKILKVLPIARKWEIRLIWSCQNEGIMDSGLLDPSFLKSTIRKLGSGVKIARFSSAYLPSPHRRKIYAIPATTLGFNEKDTAPFYTEELENSDWLKDPDFQKLYRINHGSTYQAEGFTHRETYRRWRNATESRLLETVYGKSQIT